MASLCHQWLIDCASGGAGRFLVTGRCQLNCIAVVTILVTSIMWMHLNCNDSRDICFLRTSFHQFAAISDNCCMRNSLPEPAQGWFFQIVVHNKGKKERKWECGQIICPLADEMGIPNYPINKPMSMITHFGMVPSPLKEPIPAQDNCSDNSRRCIVACRQ